MNSDPHNEMETDRLQDPLPRPIMRALSSAAREVSASEVWVSGQQSAMAGILARLVAMMHGGAIGRAGPLAQPIREQSLRLLAYLPAELRFAALLNVVRTRPDAIDDMLSGHVRQEYVVYRYNILSSLGVFARHGLVEEVFTRERMQAVGPIIGRVRKPSSRDEQ